jgi:hypothetical protein
MRVNQVSGGDQVAPEALLFRSPVLAYRFS